MTENAPPGGGSGRSDGTGTTASEPVESDADEPCEVADELIDETVEESFPASDPSSSWAGPPCETR